MRAGEVTGRTLRGLGLRRKHLTGFPLRHVVRVLTRRGLVSWDKLSGPPLDLVYRMNLPGASFLYHVVPDDLLGIRLFWEGWRYWEPDTLVQFSRFAGFSPRILDVGAHTVRVCSESQRGGLQLRAVSVHLRKAARQCSDQRLQTALPTVSGRGWRYCWNRALPYRGRSDHVRRR